MGWIWSEKETHENVWVMFAKDIYFEQKPLQSRLYIAVDTKYWLYINGEMIVFEGGVKRGPGFHQTYFDEVDLCDYLIQGNNRLAVLVWYFGKSGFSHCSSGHGGLHMELEVDNHTFYTDSSWKYMDYVAYVQEDKTDIRPNFRLAEPNLYYDAVKATEEWWKPDYDIENWKNAVEVEKDYWGKFVHRRIPQWKNSGLQDYINADEVTGKEVTNETTIAMALPYNAQITPYFDIEVSEGKRIDIFTDTYDTFYPEEKNTKSVYYTKNGRQTYESLGWMNGEIVYYKFPTGTRIHSLQYRETGYDTVFVGDFHCKNAFFNRLYEKCRRTLYVTMRDTFMDCPDRERVQWWGDVNLEMQMMFYCLDEKAKLLYEKGVSAMAEWARHYGHMTTVVPSGTEQFELPLQNLAGIYGFYYYFERTGNISILQEVYPMSKAYVLSYEFDANTIIKHKTGSWDWADWGENADVTVMENAWLFMAAKSCLQMASTLGYTEDIEIFTELIKRIDDKFYEKFWMKEGFYYNTANGKPDDRANALAVLAGPTKKQDYPVLRHIFETTYNASPYMEKYVLDAICQMGYLELALCRMKDRYKEMVEDSGTTLWEYWNKDGTRNHAWSGGPLIILMQYQQEINQILEGKNGKDEAV